MNKIHITLKSYNKPLTCLSELQSGEVHTGYQQVPHSLGSHLLQTVSSVFVPASNCLQVLDLYQECQSPNWTARSYLQTHNSYTYSQSQISPTSFATWTPWQKPCLRHTYFQLAINRPTWHDCYIGRASGLRFTGRSVSKTGWNSLCWFLS